MVYGLIYNGCQRIRIQGSNHPVYNCGFLIGSHDETRYQWCEVLQKAFLCNVRTFKYPYSFTNFSPPLFLSHGTPSLCVLDGPMAFYTSLSLSLHSLSSLPSSVLCLVDPRYRGAKAIRCVLCVAR